MTDTIATLFPDWGPRCRKAGVRRSYDRNGIYELGCTKPAGHEGPCTTRWAPVTTETSGGDAA